MKVLLISFSGTGHTFMCGEYIKKHFIELGHSCDHFPIKEGSSFDIDYEDYDLIGFGYPIHAFNAPVPFVKFIKSLPKLKEKKKYFIFKVSGEPFAPNNASSYHSYLKLKRKNFVLYGEKHFLMPYNIIFRYRDSIAKQMYLYLPYLTKAFVLELLGENPEKIFYAPWHVVWSAILRIEWIAPFFNAPFVRVKKDKCVNCYKCIKECPCNALFINKKGNIRIKARKCSMCMRCTMHCPTDAFRYGFMNPWKVSGTFNYEKIKNDPSVPAEFINSDTKGYFKLFNKYFNKQKVLLEKYNIPNPIEEYSKQ